MDKLYYQVWWFGNSWTPTTPDGHSNYKDSKDEAEEFRDSMSEHCKDVSISVYKEDAEGFLSYNGEMFPI